MVAACRTVEGRLPNLAAIAIHPPAIRKFRHLRGRTGCATARASSTPGSPRSSTAMRSSDSWVSFHIEEQGAFDHQDKMPDRSAAGETHCRRRSQAADVPRDAGVHPAAITTPTARSNCAPLSSAAISARRSTTAASMSGSAPRRNCRTIRRCICARWPMRRDFSLLDAAMARYGRTLFDKRLMAGEPRSRDVVSSPVPRRRMAALCAGFPERAGRPRADPRHDLQAGRHAGGLGRGRRLASPAAGERGCRGLRYAALSTSSNCETYQLVYQRSTQGIGIRNMQPTATARVRHSISRPDALNTISRCRALTFLAYPSHPGGGDPSPADDGYGRDSSSTCQPT